MLFIVGVACGFFLFWIAFQVKKGGFDKLATAILEQAEKEASEKKAQHELALQAKEAEHQEQMRHIKRHLEIQEKKLSSKDAALDEKFHLTLKHLNEIEKKETLLTKKKEELEAKIQDATLAKERLLTALETISSMTKAEAKESLLAQIETEIKADAAKRLHKRLEEAAQEETTQVAKILATTFSRLQHPVSTENTITSVHLPSVEMKARIIGKEGRNIRALEHLTGVNILVDETPNAIVLSSLDPLRQQIAKTALTELVQDGRIHPTRIEEAVAKAKLSVDKLIYEKGENAFFKTGLTPGTRELTHLLGSLYFRTSLGENILEHSIVVAHILGLMAAEIGLDPTLAKRMGLLHDIGKAVTQEKEGSHACVGQEIALKMGESEIVANGIGAHHDEIPPLTIEASLVTTANKLAHGRAGSCLESMEQHVKRLKKLEALSASYPGVEHAFALQSGKEVRVIVTPDTVNDKEMLHLARTIAKRIEEEITFVGKIKVSVIREKKAVEYAV